MIRNTVKLVFIASVILGINGCSSEEKSEQSVQQISTTIDAAYLNDESFQPNKNTVAPSGQPRIEIPLLEENQSNANQPAVETSETIDLNSVTDQVEINQQFENSSEESISSNKEIIEKPSEIDAQSKEPVTELEPTFSQLITDSRAPYEKILEELLTEYQTIDYSSEIISNSEKEQITRLCQKISNRLGSVSLKGCLAANHRLSAFTSVNGLPIVVTEFAPKPEREPLGRVLVIGGTHGDELTSISTAYKWITNLNKFHSGLFHWHIAPSINPDGLLTRPATRTNANGIDINRNLPTPDWDKQSIIHWEKTDKNTRRNPGTEAASEPESRWIMHEIATFKPDAIISIHAPYGVLDFDSPELRDAPRKFGRLKLNLLGTYPGSLGNYAGIERQIPVLTLELPNATSMPPQKELDAIWQDMIDWLRQQFKKKAS